jgi:hypothetical protein
MVFYNEGVFNVSKNIQINIVFTVTFAAIS